MAAHIGIFSKTAFKYVVLSNIFTILFLFCLVFVPFNGNTQFDIVTNTLFISKIIATFILLMHIIVRVFINLIIKEKENRVIYSLKDVCRSCVVFILSIICYHFVAILFGAALSENTSETFHFALVLSSATVGPILIHLGCNPDLWIRIFALNSCESCIETMVYIATITSFLGAWLGAFPIPLDWDRPWQVWPITCILGTVVGHCAGLLLSTLYTCVQVNKHNKFKLT